MLREEVAVAHNCCGAIASMVAAVADPESALYASCVTMRAAGTRLLSRAQAERMARIDIDGADIVASAILAEPRNGERSGDAG